MKPFIPQKLPPGDVNWEAHLPLIGKANRSIAYYDGTLNGVPNPDLLLSPLTTKEAVLSSKVEGTQATLGEVLKFEAGEEPEQESRRLDIQEIRNYRLALRHAENELKSRPFNLNLLLNLHSILLDSVRGNNKGRGQFRRTQNWIGSPGSDIEQADFVPPDPTIVMDFLSDWEKSYHSDPRDLLVHLAIVHAQFEIIHPFLDGNGRIGRILIPLYLYEKKLVSRPIFYLSTYIEKHRDEYISRLRAIGNDKEAWDDWIRFFLIALDEQARENTEKAKAIMDLYERMKVRVIGLTRSQYAIPVLDYMFGRPVFRVSEVWEGIDPKPSSQVISVMVRALRDTGILKIIIEGSGRRPQILAFAELVNLCEGTEVF